METTTETEAIHPLGEGEFAFPTPGGRMRLSVTSDTLTPFGGLVPWAAFTKHIGIIDELAGSCPVERTSPNASPVYDVLQSFVLTALTDGRRFSHIERLREDPAIPEIFGMESVVGDTPTPEAIALIARTSEGVLRAARNLTLATLIEAVRAQKKQAGIELVNKALLQPHWGQADELLAS